MYWLALHLPALPLDAVSDTCPVLHHKAGERSLDGAGHKHPSGILDNGRLVALSMDATAAGAHIGMTLAAASSMAPGLIAAARQPHREAALLQRLALALSGCTPSIVIEPDGLRLELSATLRLFGGRRALLRCLEAIVHDCGVEQIRLAHASTPAAASLIARTETSPVPRAASLSALTQQSLDHLPINAVLRLWSQPRALVDLLQGIGCRTLRDLRDLPRGGLTRRGGRQLMSLVARAYGDEPDPQVMFEPPPSFELGLELMQRADEAGALVFAVQRLVQPLVGWLALHWLAASRLTVKLRHETSRRREQPDSVLEIALAQPSRDAAQIMLLLRERLQRMSLPAPVYAIVLRLENSASHAGRAGALWASPSSQLENEKVLIDRLSARLGHDRVQRVQLCSDHRPERAMRWVSAQELPNRPPSSLRSLHPEGVCRPSERPGGLAGPGDSERAWAITPSPSAPPGAPRPAWLLAQPLPLRDDGTRPIYKGKPLLIISRAERIEAGWFDDDFASRDYHVAVSDDVCCWIYRERRADARPEPGPSPAGRWFLHGIFG